jgi:ABC-type transport system involved in multi-copper enzyme maturation permease subunit
MSQGGELTRFVKGLTMLVGPACGLVFLAHLTVPNERALAAGWAITLLTVVWLGSVLLLAAGTLSRERERRTLESLLSTPLEVTEILAGKAIGCLYGARWVGALLGMVLVIGVASGGLSLTAGLAILVGWTVWTAFFLSLGMWFSSRYASTTRAVFLTVVCGVLLLAGPPIVAVPLSRLARHLDWTWSQILTLESAIHHLSPATTAAELTMPKGTPIGMGFFPLFAAAALALAISCWSRLRRETEQY